MKLESLALWDEKELFTECGKSEQGYLGCAKFIFTRPNIFLEASSLKDNVQSAVEQLLHFLKSEDAFCVVHDKANMEAFCYNKMNDHIPYSFNRECWGFRIIDEDIIWYLACTPWNVRCHFTVYAYDKNTLLSFYAEQRNLPLWCYGVYRFTGERIRIWFGIREIERYPQYGGDSVANSRYANEMNEEIEVDISQRAAMENGAIYGWDTPMANLDNYEDGRYCAEEREKRKK